MCKVAHTDGAHLFTRRASSALALVRVYVKEMSSSRRDTCSCGCTDIAVLCPRGGFHDKGSACVEKPFIAVLAYIPTPPTPDQHVAFFRSARARSSYLVGGTRNSFAFPSWRIGRP